jgi:hypothetical protein
MAKCSSFTVLGVPVKLSSTTLFAIKFAAMVGSSCALHRQKSHHFFFLEDARHIQRFKYQWKHCAMIRPVKLKRIQSRPTCSEKYDLLFGMKPSLNTGILLYSIALFHVLLTLLFTRHAIEAVNRMLQDISSTKKSFAGITVVFGGDFQQTLPVVVKGT